MRLTRPLLLAAGVVAAWCTLATPTTARAYEQELSLGLEAGFAYLVGLDLPGARAGLHASYGVDDTWTLAAQLGYSIHAAEAEPFHFVEAAAEILYVIDVVRVVPYFGLGASWFGKLYGDEVGAFVGAHLVGGGHYYLSRSWAIGLDVRGHALLNALDDFPIYLTTTLRISFLQAL